MKSKLATWLQENGVALRDETLRRALNLLPDEEAVDEFLKVLVEALGEGVGGRLRVVQAWADNSVGQDAPLANDWMTVLRTLKDVIGDALAVQFATVEALAYFRELDRIITYAVIEATRLASDTDRVDLLDHMVELRQRMARLDRNKASFIKVAAHELRTPLTILDGYTSMMRATVPPDITAVQPLLEGFESGIGRLRSIIADMIDMTMIDADAIDIRFQPVHLEKILLMVTDSQQKVFRERQVELAVEPAVVEDVMYADPERLFQALSKVISNSLKYTPDGGRVAVSTHLTRPNERTDEIAGYVVIVINDTGIGIEPENLERIFETFSGIQDFSLHSSGKTKFKGGGAGLGLPIARGIIEAHGGRVWADSPGCDEVACPGSTFYIELPIRVRPPGEGAPDS
ncbi:MAG: HAMP domain-containing histidine kinase [Chloroflexi bacterium]|nr:HAMP domain-containing histidine kinase [Chloroflexota bacterium]MCI0577323.1 HAMP domain-containing histidine kinase [Chloroflexota bacterium]MCI0646824.1 HAMP domain-containing histidine kinase [Chloroflexota bacterium]MCI0728126.1 HAMP domain-containing histidine kinase [Chloroflexota bacterium]